MVLRHYLTPAAAPGAMGEMDSCAGLTNGRMLIVHARAIYRTIVAVPPPGSTRTHGVGFCTDATGKPRKSYS
jgi:hypothetical protein